VGDVIWVGGNFSLAVAPDGSSAARSNLAAFDAMTGAVLSMNPGPNGRVRALATDGQDLFVGGFFSSIGGHGRQRLASIDGASGALNTAFTANASAQVYALDYRAGRLWVGGAFSWDPQPSATVLSVRANAAGSRIFIAGDFTSVNGHSRVGVAGTAPNGDLVGPAFSPSYSPSLDLDLNADGSRLFVAAGGSGNQAAPYDTSSGSRLWPQRAEGDVQAVHHRSGEVYFGFHEGFEGDFTQRMKAADAGSGAIDPEFAPTFDRFWGVWDISSTPTQLLVAGDFSQLSGVEAEGFVRLPAVGVPPTTTTTTTTSTTTIAPGTPSTPVAFGSTWRYFDSGTDPGSGWIATGFDDSGWQQGQALLGYGDADISTVVSFGPDSRNKYRTTYFRREVGLGNTPTSATVSLVVDDGAAVYFNGVEAIRQNLPTGPIGYSTYASSGVEGGAERATPSYALPAGALHGGSNTIAVEVHQVWRTSSDMAFDLELVAEGSALSTTTTTTSTTTTAPPSTTTSTSTTSTTTTTQPPAGPTTLVPVGSTWRYHDQGADLGTGWCSESYPDGGWASGPAPLGSLTLSLVADDGAVVYVNGVEVARDNMPRGSIGYLTYASSGVEGSAEPAMRTFVVPGSVAHLGTNTVAVEIHQVWRRSSDIRFDLGLVSD
jgi:hypothetical protein